MPVQRSIADMTTEQAVSYFPRGLLQPEGSFRFAADALLLSCLFPPGKGKTLLDIGSGCGVVALGALLRSVCARAAGIEIAEELTRAANANAKYLGLGDKYACFQYDAGFAVTSRTAIEELSFFAAPGKTDQSGAQGPGFDYVLANPPFYQPGSGRLPASALRRQALFAQEHTLADFCNLAAMLLQEGGCFGLIYPTEGRGRLDAALAGCGLHIHRLLPVIFRTGKGPERYLVEAAKEPAVRPVIQDPPLILHDKSGMLTPAAKEFCPFLETGR